MNYLSIFTSHYSIGKSILTLDKLSDVKENGPDSIIDLCIKNNIKDLFLVDNCMSGFIEGYKNSIENKLNYHFGLKISINNDINEKTDESFDKTSEIIIFIKNNQGYKDLLKIYSKGATDGFYYKPRIDWKILNELWTENLLLVIPFYDSFIFDNTLRFCYCVPDFTKIKPIFFIEEHDLPFNDLIKEKVLNYCKENEYDWINAHSIYYNKKEDYKAYLTFRCINKRSSIERPQMEHHNLDTFCLESYLEKIK